MRALRQWMGRPEVRALLALAFILAIGCVFNANDAFFRWGTHRDMLRQVSVYGILACGMTLVIVVGGIDLSVGSVLGLCAVVFAKMSLHLGLPALAAVPAVLAVGAAAGLVSGTAVAR